MMTFTYIYIYLYLYISNHYLSFSGGVVSQNVCWHTGFVVINNYPYKLIERS
jgi:hypothetical protein